MSDEYSNLPPGTCDGDPRAPWNEGDGDSHDGATCGTCRHLCTVWSEADAVRAIGHACAIDAAYGDLYDVRDDTTPCAFWWRCDDGC